jgi:hypothetical protein
MPLITLVEFKGLLKKDVAYLDIANADEFVPIELAASEIVVQKTGITVPENEAEAPPWVKLPMALICLWIAANRNDAISGDMKDDTNAKYKAAIDILSDNKVKSNKGVTRSGNITEAYLW